MSLPSSFASAKRKFPSCKRIKTAVVPIGSAMGAPAVVVSRSIFLRMVHSLFHHDAWALFAAVRNKMTAQKPERGDVRLMRFAFMFVGPSWKKSKICPKPNGDERIERICLDQIAQWQARIE